MIKKNDEGAVIWITGLSGAGKSTLAKSVYKKLSAKKKKLVLLDGDELRKVFSPFNNGTDSHTKENRLRLAFSYSNLCQMLQEQDFTIIISTISMFNEIYDFNQKQLKNYYEVYLKTSLNELKRRDPKGIYSKFERGEISSVAGLDLEVDEPFKPSLVFEFPSKLTLEEISDKVVNLVR